MEQPEWFDSRDDAARYLGEIAFLWGVWLVGLVVLLVAQGLWVIGISVVLIVVLFRLLRPLQARARERPNADEISGDETARGRGARTEAEAALRELVYGSGPLEAALAAVGASPAWRWVRHAVIVGTLAGFLAMVALLFRGPS